MHRGPISDRGIVRRRAILAGLVLALAIGGLAPPEQAAASTTPTRTVSTFELLPDAGLVRVKVEFTITNRIASTTTSCPGYLSCTTNYYVNAGGVAADPDGVNFRASTPGGGASVSVESGGEGYLSTATVRFPNTYYGRSRTVTLTYDIPGGAPRSGVYTRAGQAYASFCAFPGGMYAGDPESLRIVLPIRYTTQQTGGAPLHRSVAGGKTILTSAESPRPESGEWRGACVEAVDDDAFITDYHTSQGGIEVEVQAWPEDAEWLSSVSGRVVETLDALEALIGRAPRSDAIVLREVVSDWGGWFVNAVDRVTAQARVSEQALDPVVAAHELAHTWYNQDFSAEAWLYEGYAEYLARSVVRSDAAQCRKPFAATLDGVDLSPWFYPPPLPTDDDWQAVRDEYRVACWVVTEVGERVGEDAMREVYAAAVDGEIAYLGAGSAEFAGGGPIDWKEWLDLVDERGLVPAGDQDLDWLQDLLLQTGVAASTAELADRSEARAAYHRLADELGGWSMPIVIRSAMSDWSWAAASAALATTEQIDEAADAAREMVAALEDSDAVESAFEAAESQDDLDAALALATTEQDAAAAVAAAIAAGDAERGPFEWIGLIGSDLAGAADEAVAELVDAEFDAATDTADAAVATGAGATTSGLLRLGGLLVLVIGAGGGVMLVRRRRARAAVVAAEG